MNTLMVDVTGDQDRIDLNDEVVLFGRQGGEFVSQAEFEKNSASYAPDLLAVLGNSLPKMLKRPERFLFCRKGCRIDDDTPPH